MVSIGDIHKRSAASVCNCSGQPRRTKVIAIASILLLLVLANRVIGPTSSSFSSTLLSSSTLESPPPKIPRHQSASASASASAQQKPPQAPLPVQENKENNSVNDNDNNNNDNDDDDSLMELEINVQPNLCPDAKRLGADSAEGGWWTCRPPSGPACVVYSFGIRDDFSFDQAIHSQYKCQVHGFDPSPDGVKSKPQYQAWGGHYHDFGLGPNDATVPPGQAPFRWPGIGYLRQKNTAPWTLKRIPTTMRELGHTRLQYLKVDAEGAEWDALIDLLPLLSSNALDELAVELHFPPAEHVNKYVKSTSLTTEATQVTIRRKPNAKHADPAEPAWLNRLAILKKLIQVAHVWKVEPNPADGNCMNVYFRSSPSR